MLFKKYEKPALYALLIFLLAGNMYYFFIRVSPIFYFSKIFCKPQDPILRLALYNELKEEYKILNEKQANKKVVVFVGDSITRRFNLQEYFPDLFILNRGIFDDTTLGVLRRLNQNINNLDINKLFLMIGLNDLAYRTNHEILYNISLMLSRIKAHKVYIQSILPVNACYNENNARIVELNRRLKDMCEQSGNYYVDLHSHFLDEQQGLDRKYSCDGVHPNAYGYYLWSTVLAPIINFE